MFDDSKTFSSISKLCLIYFALKCSGITHSKQPLLSFFKTIYHNSEDFQVEESKGKLIVTNSQALDASDHFKKTRVKLRLKKQGN